MHAQDEARATANANADAASKDPEVLAQARANLKASGNDNPTQDELNQAAYQVVYDAAYKTAYEREMKTYGTGSKVQQAIQAANAALQGIMGGNLGAAAAGASAPYLAQAVKELTEGKEPQDKAINAISHAIVGALVAQASGTNALAGAAGAGGGELLAGLIIEKLYPGKEAKDLTEAQRQTVLGLATIAAGALGGAAGSDMTGIATAANAGHNAVKNNAITGSMIGKTDEEIRQGMENQIDVACSGNLKQCQDMFLAGTTITLLPLFPKTFIISSVINSSTNVGIQYLANGSVDPRDAIYAGWVGIATAGSGVGGTVAWNAAGGALSSYTKDENPWTGGLSSAITARIGYGIGKKIEISADKLFNPSWKNWTFTNPNNSFLGVSKPVPKDPLPELLGNIGGSLSSDGLSKISEQGNSNEIKK
jgi:filamentous hemagglutinin